MKCAGSLGGNGARGGGAACRPRCRCGWPTRCARPTPNCTTDSRWDRHRPIPSRGSWELSNPAILWRKSGQALAGTIPWNEGLLALTRLAELQKPAYADSAEQLMHRIMEGEVQGPPGIDPGDLIEPLRAIVLQVERVKVGDAAMRARILEAVPSGKYGLADAWTLGRLGGGTSDTLMALFKAAPDENLKVRYLTLLSFSDDPVATPFLAAIYESPDSAGIPAARGDARVGCAALDRDEAEPRGADRGAGHREDAWRVRRARALPRWLHVPRERQFGGHLTHGAVAYRLDGDAQAVAVTEQAVRGER